MLVVCRLVGFNNTSRILKKGRGFNLTSGCMGRLLVSTAVAGLVLWYAVDSTEEEEEWAGEFWGCGESGIGDVYGLE